MRKLSFNILRGPQYERPWLIYSHCLVSFNISSKNNDFVFSSIQKKNTFHKNSHLNALGSKYDLTLSRSRSTKDHYLNKLGRPYIPNATYQVPRSSAFWFWRRFLKGFYHIWARRPSWSCDQDHLNKPRSPDLRSLDMKFEFNWPSGFRGEDV